MINVIGAGVPGDTVLAAGVDPSMACVSQSRSGGGAKRDLLAHAPRRVFRGGREVWASIVQDEAGDGDCSDAGDIADGDGPDGGDEIERERGTCDETEARVVIAMRLQSQGKLDKLRDFIAARFEMLQCRGGRLRL